MKSALKSLAVAMLAASAAAIGTALGELARDAIKDRWGQLAKKAKKGKR